MAGKIAIPIPIQTVNEEGGTRIQDLNVKAPGFIAEVLLKEDNFFILKDGRFRSVEVDKETHERKNLLFRTPVDKPLAQYLSDNKALMRPPLAEVLQNLLEQRSRPEEPARAKRKWSAAALAASGVPRPAR